VTTIDYHGLRAAKRFGDYPDDMVHEVAEGVEARILASKVATPDDIAWLYESLRRREPRVVRAVVSESIDTTEVVG
jgi:hypothetical protein